MSGKLPTSTEAEVIRALKTKKEPPAIPSLPAAHKVLSFSPKQRTSVT